MFEIFIGLFFFFRGVCVCVCPRFSYMGEVKMEKNIKTAVIVFFSVSFRREKNSRCCSFVLVFLWEGEGGTLAQLKKEKKK